MELKIKELRKSNFLTQAKIAEYLGCSQQVYSRYETGRIEPSLKTMARLAEYYGVTVDYLMGRAEK